MRWLYSSNHKDIGTMHFLLGTWAGCIWTMMSMIIRMELSMPGSFMVNEKLYNTMYYYCTWILNNLLLLYQLLLVDLVTDYNP